MSWLFGSATATTTKKTPRVETLRQLLIDADVYNNKKMEIITDRILKSLDEYLEHLSRNGISKYTLDMNTIPYKQYNNDVSFKPSKAEMRYMRERIVNYLADNEIPYTTRDNIFFLSWQHPILAEGIKL